MAAAKRTGAGTGQGKTSLKVLQELNGIAVQLRNSIAQLEAVVERMVGAGAVEAGGRTSRGENGSRNEAARESLRPNGSGQQFPQLQSQEDAGTGSSAGAATAPPAQAVAGQLRKMLSQLESLPGNASGEAAVAVAGQLRHIVERLGPRSEPDGVPEADSPQAGQGELQTAS